MNSFLTPRQREVYRFIERSIAERGFPPTVSEIAANFGMRSPNAAAQHLRLMRRKGALEIEPGVARGIRLAAAMGEPGAPAKRVRGVKSAAGAADAARAILPVVGRVAAGTPILAEENLDGELAVHPSVFRPRADYLLRVAGDSMVECGIHDGDLVAVRKTPEVRQDAIAVVRVGSGAGEVTVKRVHRKGTLVKLIPENSRMKTRVVDLTQEPVTVEGEVVGVLRLGARSGSVRA
jgi:repressor LexA